MLIQIGVLLRDWAQVVAPPPGTSNAAGVRLRLRGLQEGGSSTSGSTDDKRDSAGQVGVSSFKICDPCGVAGTKLRVGGGGREPGPGISGGAKDGGARIKTGKGANSEAKNSSTIQISELKSEGVICVTGTDDEPKPSLRLSLAIGSLLEVQGET